MFPVGGIGKEFDESQCGFWSSIVSADRSGVGGIELQDRWKWPYQCDAFHVRDFARRVYPNLNLAFRDEIDTAI